jgi:hypothetical protein
MKDEEARFFQKIAEKGHYEGRTFPSTTQQGTYMAAPNGTLLASINTRDPVLMEEKMREALAKWKTIPKAERTKPSGLEGAYQRWRNEDFYPSDGLVLRMTTRDLPRPELPRDWRATAWNQDFAWFRKEEVRSMLPDKIEAGQSKEVPTPLVERLARYHLVDIVRGQSLHYPPNAVREAKMTVTVQKVQNGIAEVAVTGRTKTHHGGRWAVAGYKDLNQPSEQTRGVETQILGKGQYNIAAGRFLKLDLVALGTRFGGTAYNARGDDLAASPIGFLFSVAGNTPPERVAPAAFWDYGWKK